MNKLNATNMEQQQVSQAQRLPPAEVDTNLQENKKNPLTEYRKMVDLDSEFLVKFWYCLDVFDSVQSNQQLEDNKKYYRIVADNPDVFIKQSDIETDREQTRVQTHQALKFYFEQSKKVMPPQEVFTDVMKFTQFIFPIASYKEDCSVKFTVNLQLAYKTIDNLGTEQHANFKRRLETGEDTGCFALTELGHGSNVRGILTTATYDKEQKQFIINTPCKEAMKFWIGGAGKTSNMCVAFAQLIIDGKNEGPHAFVVPLRDRRQHLPLPGITLGDCGKKAGLDGIDNGFIIFDNVRIPKANFLNKLSDVTDDGRFVSPIKSAEQRFGLSLGGLSTGRIILMCNMQQKMEYALKVALRFAVLRKQFGSPGKPESPLIDYALHQYRLFPYLGAVFSIRNTLHFVVDQWSRNQKKIFQPGNHKLAELHALISAIKAISSWSAYACIHEARKSCGGLGYSFYSRFSESLAGCDINCTWEGDNNVLLQQTAKYLLDAYKAKMKQKGKPTVTCEWITLDDVTEEKCKAETIEDFLQPENLKKVFEYRCNKLLQKCAMKLGGRMMNKAEGEDAFSIWNDEQVFGAQELALAYGECTLVHFDAQFIAKIQSREKKDPSFVLKPDTKEIFNLLFQLGALHRINKDIGSWYEHGYFTPDHGDMIRDHIKVVLQKMKRFAIGLTDTVRPGDELLDNMLAPNDGELYKSIQNKIYSAPKAFERISNWKELIAKPKL